MIPSRRIALLLLLPCLFSCHCPPLSVEEAREIVDAARLRAKKNPPKEFSSRVVYEGLDPSAPYRDEHLFVYSEANAYLHSRGPAESASGVFETKEEWVYCEGDALIHAVSEEGEKTYRAYPFVGTKEDAFLSLPRVQEGQKTVQHQIEFGFDAFEEIFSFYEEFAEWEESGVQWHKEFSHLSCKEGELSSVGLLEATSSDGEKATILRASAFMTDHLPHDFSIETSLFGYGRVTASYAYAVEPSEAAKPNLAEFVER